MRNSRDILVRVDVQVGLKQREAMQALAAARGVPVSRIIRNYIHRGLASDGFCLPTPDKSAEA